MIGALRGYIGGTTSGMDALVAVAAAAEESDRTNRGGNTATRSVAVPAGSPAARAGEAKPGRPAFFRNVEALRFTLNANPVYGLLPCVRRTPQPTYGERLWLLTLYLITGVFLEHLALLYGPICRTAYETQCGQDMYERTHTHADRRLDALKTVANAGGDLQDSIGSSRMMIASAFAGHIELNCKMTKCDHWQHVNVDGTPDDGDDSDSYFTFQYWPGLCRCDHTPLQKITFRVAVACASVVFQTILINALMAVLKKDWESAGGWKGKLNRCVMWVLTIVLVAEMAAIWLIRFVPEAWIISLVVSGTSVMTVTFIFKYILAHVGIASIPDELKDAPLPAADNPERPLLDSSRQM